MERQYYVRDRLITIEEIEDVRAVRVAADDAGQPIASGLSFGQPASSALQDAAASTETIAAFEKANWVFTQPSASMMAAMDADESVDSAVETGKVMRRPDGSIVVATTRLSVQLKPDFSEEACEKILEEKGLEILIKLRFAPNLYEVRALGRADALEVSVELHDDERFTLAEPAFVEHIPQRFTPADPDFGDQWQWSNTGQGGGTVGADVSAEAAWDTTRGAGIRIAVIDNGFDADHVDLDAGVVGESGFYTDAGAGSPANFTQGTVGIPDSNHGTFCAGMAASRHNNGTGGCGAAPESDLMLIACLGDQVGTQVTLARAVGYAANPTTEVAGADPADGADILVSSLGPNGATWNLTATLQMALEWAATNGRNGRGLAIFWAASNGNNVNIMLDEVVSHPDVIAVVRSTRNDLEDNAARGAATELIAPGVDVYATFSGDNYGTWTGTSFAAPCAAGCAALALSVNPNLTRDELRQIMRDTADEIGGVVYDGTGHNDDYGFGRVNAAAAVQRVLDLLNAPPVLQNIPPIVVDENSQVNRMVLAADPEGEPLTFSLNGPPFATLTATGANTAKLAVQPGFDDSGNYLARVRAIDPHGEFDEKFVSIMVRNVNRPPVLANIGPIVAHEGSSLIRTITATDPDLQAVAFNATGLPGFAVFNDEGSGTGRLTLQPDYKDAGLYHTTMSVTDPEGATDSESFSIRVINVLMPLATQITELPFQPNEGVIELKVNNLLPNLASQVQIQNGAGWVNITNANGDRAWFHETLVAGEVVRYAYGHNALGGLYRWVIYDKAEGLDQGWAVSAEFSIVEMGKHIVVEVTLPN
jgi:hypothetical protein